MDDFDPMLDALVIAEVRAGNRQAYGIFIDRYQVRLRAALSACLLNDDEVEAFTQDAFVQAFVQLEQYDHSQPFYPWVRSIAMNSLRIETRARGSAAPHAGDYLRQVLLEQVTEETADERRDARVNALESCLANLPPDAAALLQDKYHSGHSSAELAARHRTSEGVLKVRLLHLRDRLCEGSEQTTDHGARRTNTHDDLLAEVLDGNPDATTLATFAELIRQDGTLRERFLAQVAIAGALRARHVQTPALTVLRNRTLATLMDPAALVRSGHSVFDYLPSRTQLPRRRSWLPFNLAATALLMVMVMAMLLLVERAPIAAGVRSAGADAVVERHGNLLDPQSVGTVRSGDRFISGSQPLILVFHDGTAVVMAPDSRMVIERVVSPKRLRLEHGNLTAQVAKQPSTQPLLVFTPRSTVTVIETRLNLSTGSDRDFIAVQQGAVEIVRRSDNEHTTLSTGRALGVTANQSLIPINIAPHTTEHWNGTGSGLRGDYYADQAFIRLAGSRIDPQIHFNWAGSPIDTVPEDHFTVRWSGRLQPRVSAAHTFTIRADDGVRMWVNGVVVIDTWSRPDIADQRGTMSLDAGHFYDVCIEYFDSVNAAEITWWWEAPGQAKEIVPTSQLYPPP